jgi:DNA primase catalytic core
MTDWERYKEEVRARTDIAAVIGRHVNLKRQGTQMVGRCPFHDDHSPSLYVTAHPGFYKCFVCGAGGDVFRFLIEHEKVTFREALEQLGREAGIEPPKSSDAFAPAEEEGKKARNALLWAQGWYHQRMRDTPAVLDYARKRGFTPEELSDFQIGFAPEESGVFLRAAREAGLSEDILEVAGLVSRTDTGWRERFRCRLVFPLCDQSKRPLGFAGRILRKDDRAPKYLNSPETRFYHKSRFLYGLSHARSECVRSQEAILVEGYMDWFALWRHGFRNVVAVSGTSFTSEQSKLLRNFCKRVVCLFDGDKAGQAATQRSLPILLEQGFEVRFCTLEGSGFKDPDELLLAKGTSALQEVFAKAPHWEAWMVDDFARLRSERSPEDIRDFLKFIESMVDLIPDDVTRRSTWEKLAPRLAMANLRVQDLRVRHALPSRVHRAANGAQWKGRERAEANFLHTLLTHPTLALDILQDIHPSQLRNQAAQEVLDAILAQAETGNPDASAVLEYLEPESLSYAQELFRFFPLKLDEITARKAIGEFVATLRTETVRKERARILLTARASGETGDALEGFSALLAQEQHLRETESQA